MGELRRLCYQYKETHYQSFKRYMFRWDGIVSGSVFQLARLMIDDVDLPYTYVNWGASGGNTISTQPATAMIASTSSYDNPNLKWCRTSVNSSSYGWIIFDLPDTHEIHSYRVLTGEDTALDTGRNPLRIRLYGTTSEATTDSDASWVLLSDVSNSGNSNIPTSNRTWSKYFRVEPIDDSLSFKTFKWVLKGRWNQGTGNSGNTRTYQQWDELGISYVGSGGVKYGPTYWTVDSFSSSGTLWAPGTRGPADLFDGEWGSETSKCDYSGIDDTNGYVEIIIHTTSGEAIIPNGVGLISANLQSNYQSSTPGHFILYGLDERTNEYIQLIDVPAANVNKGNTQTTTVSFEPTPIIKTKYLLAPSEIGHGVGLRGTVPELVYLTYFDDVSTSLGYINSTPLIDIANIGNLVSISNRFCRDTFVSTNGTMPSTYVGKNALARFNGSSAYKNDGLTWNFPYSRTDKFTVQWWGFHNQKAAGVVGPQIWTSPQYDWVHCFRNHFMTGYGFLWYGDSLSVLTGYNGAVVSNLDGPSIKISAIPRSTWHHFAVVSDGSDLHFYVDGIRYGKKTGSWTTGDFQKFLIFDDEGGTSYGLDVTEIAIYDGDISYNDHNNIPVPTKPLGS